MQRELTTEYSHELVMANEDLPFKMFLFEGKDGNDFLDKHCSIFGLPMFRRNRTNG